MPLLVSLRRRAMLAAQAPGVLEALARPLRDPSPVMKEATAQTLAAVLDADYLGQRPLRDGAADALIAALDGGRRRHRRRGSRCWMPSARRARTIGDGRRPGAWLGLDRPVPTFAERAARLARPWASWRRPIRRADVIAALEALPLDAPVAVQEAAGRALGALDPAEAARRLPPGWPSSTTPGWTSPRRSA